MGKGKTIIIWPTWAKNLAHWLGLVIAASTVCGIIWGGFVAFRNIADTYDGSKQTAKKVEQVDKKVDTVSAKVDNLVVEVEKLNNKMDVNLSGDGVAVVKSQKNSR